ncbi:MFS transporter, partial [Streptomyces sp. NPDC004976]
GDALRHAARQAFVHGLHVTLLVSAGLLLLGAAMALRLPRAMQCEAAAVEVPAPRGAVESRVSV